MRKSALMYVVAIGAIFSAASSIAGERLNETTLPQKVVGNTMSGEYASGVSWREYFDPSGQIRGFDDKRGNYLARYSFSGDVICFDYDIEGADWCGNVDLAGDAITFYLLTRAKVTDPVSTTLSPGNPFDL